jgi:hypothetical protein
VLHQWHAQQEALRRSSEAARLETARCEHHVPLGRSKTLFFSPTPRALFMWLLKALSVVVPSLLLALMYFLIAWRLLGAKS